MTMKGENKMKKWFAVVAGLFFGIALLTAGAGAQQFTIKYAVSSPPDSFHQAYADKFKELCEKYSGGKIKVNVYGGAQLGSEQDNVQGCSTNMIQMTTLAVNNLTPFANSVGFMTLPYAFQKIEDAYKLYKHPFMEELNKKIVAQANVRAVSWLVGGYRVFTNSKKEVRTPEDLQGIKVRVPKNKIMIAAYKSWGVNPVPISWTETFNALQQKVVDAQDNPHIVNAASKFYEVQKYITNIHYLLWTGPNIMSEQFYKKLPADLKKAVNRAAKEAAVYEWDFVAKQEAKALKECLDKGMKLLEPADNEKEWIRRAKTVWPDMYKDIGGKAWVDQAMAVIYK
jgi:tripartite ATP-independent transporter DctP family solute receptor